MYRNKGETFEKAPARDRAYVVEEMYKRLATSEEALRVQGVPERYWCYIAANSYPPVDASDSWDGDDGTIYQKRKHIIEHIEGMRKVDVLSYPLDEGLMVSVAVDGRDVDTIRRYIGCALKTEDWAEQAEDMKRLECRGGAAIVHPMKTRSRTIDD